jgi:hypothetical protein
VLAYLGGHRGDGQEPLYHRPRLGRGGQEFVVAQAHHSPDGEGWNELDQAVQAGQLKVGA